MRINQFQETPIQVFGLPGQIIRNGRAASRLLDAKTGDIEAARRRDAIARWRRAMADELTAEQAARTVDVPRATLYRWEKAPEQKSRRPKRLRQPKWPPALADAVEAMRLDNPMWGKRKIAALLRREGFAASASSVGRVLKRLMERGRVVPVPTLRKRPEKRQVRIGQRQRYARRLAKGRKARAPGELVQIDTLFVNLRPDKAIKHFTAYDPVAKWTLGHVSTEASANAAKALLAKLIAAAPFAVKGVQPYSIDLRERAIAAVLQGGLSRHESAARFGVAPSTVINWVRRFRETGSVAPGQMGGHTPKAIAGEHAMFLSRRVRDGAFTLSGLVAELAERGLKVDYRSVWNFVHAGKLSFKNVWLAPSVRGLPRLLADQSASTYPASRSFLRP